MSEFRVQVQLLKKNKKPKCTDLLWILKQISNALIIITCLTYIDFLTLLRRNMIVCILIMFYFCSKEKILNWNIDNDQTLKQILIHLTFNI